MFQYSLRGYFDNVTMNLDKLVQIYNMILILTIPAISKVVEIWLLASSISSNINYVFCLICQQFLDNLLLNFDFCSLEQIFFFLLKQKNCLKTPIKKKVKSTKLKSPITKKVKKCKNCLKKLPEATESRKA